MGFNVVCEAICLLHIDTWCVYLVRSRIKVGLITLLDKKNVNDVHVPKSGWNPPARLQAPEAEVPHIPLDEQQSPNALYKHISLLAEAAPHFPSVDTGVQLPYFAWQPSLPAQNAGDVFRPPVRLTFCFRMPVITFSFLVLFISTFHTEYVV